jgi:hypothetical protein
LTAKMPPEAPTLGTPGNAKFPPNSKPNTAPAKKITLNESEPSSRSIWPPAVRRTRPLRSRWTTPACRKMGVKKRQVWAGVESSERLHHALMWHASFVGLESREGAVV